MKCVTHVGTYLLMTKRIRKVKRKKRKKEEQSKDKAELSSQHKKNGIII